VWANVWHALISSLSSPSLLSEDGDGGSEGSEEEEGESGSGNHRGDFFGGDVNPKRSGDSASG